MAPYDRALISMTDQISNLLSDRRKLTYYQSIKLRPQQVARGILGHMFGRAWQARRKAQQAPL